MVRCDYNKLSKSARTIEAIDTSAGMIAIAKKQATESSNHLGERLHFIHEDYPHEIA